MNATISLSSISAAHRKTFSFNIDYHICRMDNKGVRGNSNSF